MYNLNFISLVFYYAELHSFKEKFGLRLFMFGNKMMNHLCRYAGRIVGIILCIGSLASCGSNRLAVVDTNFAEEIQTTQNLIFTFSKKCKPASVALETWHQAEYMQVVPPTPGQFRWVAENKLVFSPAVGFAPSSNYIARLTPKLSTQGSAPDLKQELKFHTPYLQLIDVRTYWARSERPGKPLEARAVLSFNYEINPTQLTQLLSVQQGDRKVPLELLTTPEGKIVTYRLSEIYPEPDKALEIEFNIAKGLSCPKSNWKSQDPIHYSVVLPTADQLEIQHVASERSVRGDVITVFTNVSPLAENLKSYLTLVENEYYWEKPEVTNFEVNPLDYGFEIIANLGRESYELTIKEGLPGIVGKPLAEAYTTNITFANNAKYISFESNRGMFLTKSGGRNIGIRIQNVEQVNVKIVKIFANNLIHFIKNNSYSLGQEMNNLDLYNIESLGEVVLEEKKIETKTLSQVNGVHLLKLDFDDKRKNYRGVYAVEISSNDEYWTRAARMISITDIGLLARESQDELTVIAHSLATSEPLGNVNVQLISSNNQTLLNGTTDSKGLVTFKDLNNKKDGFKIEMIAAQAGEDYNFLHFKVNTIDNSRFDVGGKRMENRPYDAFIYADRNIYRPGETIHLNTIVRSPNWKTVSRMPVYLSILYPNGQVFRSFNAELNPQGAWATDVPLPPNTPTGEYVCELKISDDVLLGSYNLNVEEFVPDRIKVNLQLNKERLQPGESLTANVQAFNLFGPPAAGRSYETNLMLAPKLFSPPAYQNEYDFALSGPSKPYPTVTRTGQTDANGKAQQVFDLSEIYQDRGILAGKLFASVYDENGRPVHRLQPFELLTQRVFYGIKRFDSYVRTNAPLNIPLIALDVDAKPLSNVYARVQVYRNEWETVAERVYYDTRFVSKKNARLVSDKTIALNGTNSAFTFTPTRSGEYVVRVLRPGAKMYVERSFYAYGWGSTNTNSFSVNTEGNIDIVADKSNYSVNQTAKLLFRTPFEGKLLVTLERDKLYEYHVLNTENHAAALDLKLKEDYLPNVYVSATLIRPLSSEGSPFTVAHGYTSLKVEKTGTHLAVKVSGPTQSRSLRKLAFSVQTVPNAELTVAVVDEGILQLKDMATPDPYHYFYGKRALELTPYDIYGQLLPELLAKPAWLAHSKTGGGGMEAFAKRANPLANHRIKPLALWSGQLKTDGTGRATFSANIPQFSGKVRVMAVAYKDNTFGAGEHFCTIADPVVVSTGLPRFLSPGDTAWVNVTLTNTTAQATNATAQLKLSAPLALVGAAQQAAPLPANGEARLQFKIYAQNQIGEAKVEVNVTALNETFKEQIDIPVRPATPFVRQTNSGTIAAGQTQTLNLAGNGLLPGTLSTKLTLGTNPIVEFAKDLNYLIEYPHGCLEQTISTAFPQLAYQDLSRALGTKRKLNPATNIQFAIQKLKSLQVYDGGLAYWPNESNESNYFGSIYALHFLHEARNNGYKVSDDLFDKLKGYVRNQTNNKSNAYDLYQDYYYTNGQTQSFIRKEIPYSLFVLTLVGEKTVPLLNTYRSKSKQLSPDGRSLLAAAYGLIGDAASMRLLLPDNLSGIQAMERETGGSFSSPIRDKALMLYALMETQPTHPQVANLSRQLSTMLKKETYLSTQDCAFALIALGKVAKQAAQQDLNAQVIVDGKVIATLKEKNKELVLGDEVKGKKVSIQTSGKGILYYSWEINGIPAEDYTEEDSQIAIRRTYLDRNGNPLGASFTQNELIIVKLSVRALDNTALDNIVVTDILPAGLEIENPRISSFGATWTENASSPAYMDVRDDRINFFTNLPASEPHTFYYVARAVTPGIFKVGPASADAMYNGAYHSYHGGGTIAVRTLAMNTAQ